MYKLRFILLTIILSYFLHKTRAQLRTNFVVKRFELCNRTQGAIKFYGNVTTEGNAQYLSYYVTPIVPLDEKVGLTCSLEYSALKSEPFVELFMLHEKYLCKAANIYLGEFWYDIERASQLQPGLCPIPAGKYHVHGLQLDFRKITLQTFPFGRLRFIMNVINNIDSKSLMCLLIEVLNTLPQW